MNDLKNNKPTASKSWVSKLREWRPNDEWLKNASMDTPERRRVWRMIAVFEGIALLSLLVPLFFPLGFFEPWEESPGKRWTVMISQASLIFLVLPNAIALGFSAMITASRTPGNPTDVSSWRPFDFAWFFLGLGAGLALLSTIFAWFLSNMHPTWAWFSVQTSNCLYLAAKGGGLVALASLTYFFKAWLTRQHTR